MKISSSLQGNTVQRRKEVRRALQSSYYKNGNRSAVLSQAEHKKEYSRFIVMSPLYTQGEHPSDQLMPIYMAAISYVIG